MAGITPVLNNQPAMIMGPAIMVDPAAVPNMFPHFKAPNSRPPNCPQGLEYLLEVDQMLVKQQVEYLEAFTGFETANKYEIRSATGQRIFFAAEETDCCTRICCGTMRAFEITIIDNTKRHVMFIERAWRPCSNNCMCCSQCCLQAIEVFAPKDHLIGRVQQIWSPMKPRYHVQDKHGAPVLNITGPCWSCSCCGEVEFEVTAMDSDETIGMITKQFSGMAREVLTDSDNFGVNFPKDLDVNVKATLLSAVFLIDFMFFEDNSTSGDRGGIGRY